MLVVKYSYMDSSNKKFFDDGIDNEKNKYEGLKPIFKSEGMGATPSIVFIKDDKAKRYFSPEELAAKAKAEKEAKIKAAEEAEARAYAMRQAQMIAEQKAAEQAVVEAKRREEAEKLLQAQKQKQAIILQHQQAVASIKKQNKKENNKKIILFSGIGAAVIAVLAVVLIISNNNNNTVSTTTPTTKTTPVVNYTTREQVLTALQTYYQNDYKNLVDEYEGLFFANFTASEGIDWIYLVSEDTFSTKKLAAEKSKSNLSNVENIASNAEDINDDLNKKVQSFVQNVEPKLTAISDDIDFISNIYSGFIAPVMKQRDSGNYTKCTTNEVAENLLNSSDQTTKATAEKYQQIACAIADKFVAGETDINKIRLELANDTNEANKLMRAHLNLVVMDDTGIHELEDLISELQAAGETTIQDTSSSDSSTENSSTANSSSTSSN